MHVLFHALGASMGGAQRHLTSFLPSLSKIAQNGTCHVLVRQSLKLRTYENIHIHRVPDRYAAVGPARLWFDSMEVPRLLRDFGIDALVSLTNIGPIHVRVPHIIFQRNALLFAPEHMRLFRPGQVAKFRLQRLLAVAAMKRAKRIITPSHSMALLVQKACPYLPVNRFFVLPHAFDARAYADELDPTIKSLLNRPGIKLLYPALAARHKGLDLLLQIAKELPDSLQAAIYVTGGDEGGSAIRDLQKKAGDLKIGKRIVCLGRIPQSQMGSLYSACDLLLYVSAVESFGFPLLESLAFHLPIVAVDTPTNRELCGTAAKYFPPDDATAASQVIVEALRSDTYETLRVSGREQFDSRDRTWDGYARTLFDAIQTAA